MAPPRVEHPIDTLFQPATLLSVFAAGELLALILALAPETEGARLVRFGLLSFSIQWVSLFSLAVLYMLRGHLRNWSVIAIVSLVTGLLLLMTVLSAWLSHWLVASVSLQGYAWWPTSMRLFASMLCMLLFGMVALRSHWAAQTHEYRAKQAELDAIRARVNPHFLFNTLNTATALVHDQPDQAERILLDLSDLFRAALSGNEETGIEQELLLTRHYLEIEALRLGDRLDVSWTLPTPLPAISVPALSLQTLAENAIHHGIEANPTGGRILIEVVQEAGKAVLRVSNPMPVDMPTLPRHQVGLAASRSRIEAMTGGTGELRTRQDGGQFVAEIILPL